MIISDRLLAFIEKLKKRTTADNLYAVLNALEAKEQGFCTLDTETTGLDHNDQIIELAIIGPDGETRFNQRFKPTVPINPKAQAVHGISMRDLQDCPTYAEFHNQLRFDFFLHRTMVIFNSEFDLRLLGQTQKAFDVRQCLPTGMCAMQMSADVFGATNRYGTISLAKAMNAADVTFKGRPHSAEADARATRDVVWKIGDMANDVLLEQILGELLTQQGINDALLEKLEKLEKLQSQ